MLQSAKMMSDRGYTGGLGRASSTSTSSSSAGRLPPPSSSPRSPSYSKPAPGPPRNVAAPPAYSAPPGGGGAAVAEKRAPPPPPPLKAKPSYGSPAVKYVTALYDFEAQVRWLRPSFLSISSSQREMLIVRELGWG